MKLPKLKYYYVALTVDQYREFETSRRLEVEPAEIDVVTGRIRGRVAWIMCSRPSLADSVHRALHSWRQPLYVLRIAAGDIDRSALRATESDQVFEYTQTLTLPHCGVERFEIADSSESNAEIIAKVLAGVYN